MWGEERTHRNVLDDSPKLGPALFSNFSPPDPPSGIPINLNPDEHNTNSRYVLSPSQREVLLNSSRTNHEQNDKILKKRDLIPERISHLMYDIALLGESPYMTQKDWHEGPVTRKRERNPYAEFHAKRDSYLDGRGVPIQTLFSKIVSESDTRAIDSPKDVLRITYNSDLDSIISDIEPDQSLTLNPNSMSADDILALRVFLSISSKADSEAISSSDEVVTVVFDSNIEDVIADVKSDTAPSLADFEESQSVPEVDTEALFSQVGDKQIEYYETPFESPTDLWRQLVDLPLVHHSLRSTIFNSSYRSNSARLGFEFGSLIRTLPSEGNQQDEIIWGFILAFIASEKRGVQKESKRLENIIKKLENKHMSRKQDTDAEKGYDQEKYAGSPYNEITVEEVKNSGFNPNPVILQEVTYHVRVSPDQSELYKKNIQNTISKIEDKTPLREIDDIVDMVKTDCEVVLDRGRHGVTISEILAELWSNNNCGMSRTTSEEISKVIGENKRTITSALHMVTEYESQDLVTKHELVNKRDSRTSPAWDLTAYGWIVCATIFDHDDDLDWLYRYAIGPEEITLEERVKISNCLEQLNYV